VAVCGCAGNYERTRLGADGRVSVALANLLLSEHDGIWHVPASDLALSCRFSHRIPRCKRWIELASRWSEHARGLSSDFNRAMATCTVHSYHLHVFRVAQSTLSSHVFCFSSSCIYSALSHWWICYCGVPLMWGFALLAMLMLQCWRLFATDLLTYNSEL